MPRESKQNQWLWESLDQYLDRRKLKQTKQRKIIINHLIKLKSHISAEEIHGSVKKSGHNIGLATIYRTLALLADAGIVDQKKFGEDKAVFEISAPENHHDHLICLDCGKVIEFENEAIEALQIKVAETRGFKLTSHSLELFGRCQAESCPDRK